MTTLPVLGFRYWRLLEGGLRGWVYSQATWNLRGVTHAIHLPDLQSPSNDYVVERLAAHDAPGEGDDNCGLYAFNSLWMAEHGITHYMAPYFGTSRVVGAVIGGGRVAVHGMEGWRASEARIVALGYADSVPGGEASPSAELIALSERAALPLIHLAQLERYATEWGERI
ncbi:MAG: hypothetical protein ACRDNS_33090 [Trebonia sp.]